MLIHLHPDFFNDAYHVPMHASDFITLPQWQDICRYLKHVHQNTTYYLYAFEIIVTLLTGFICIFCCHVSLHYWFVDIRVDWKLNRLNRKLYRGFPVLQRIDDEIVLNTDFLDHGGVVISPTHILSPTPLDAINIVDIERGDTINDEKRNLSQEQLLQSSRERVMIIKIPDDRPSGSMFVVRTPDGINRTIKVPQHSHSGAEIVMTY